MANKQEQEQEKEQLLQHPKLWRARHLAAQQLDEQQNSIATGFDELNACLPGGGWPDSALMEVMLPSAGVGELRLFIPALKALSQQQDRWLAWINPPFIPYAPALRSLGVDINKILLVHPKDHKDALWATEKACKSGTCSTVFAWLDESQLTFKDTQRLQIAAKQGNTLSCLFRPQNEQPSMAELRLSVRAMSTDQLHLDITKRRGGWPIPGLTLPLAKNTGSQHPKAEQIEEQLALWREVQQLETLTPEPVTVANIARPHVGLEQQPVPVH